MSVKIELYEVPF